MTVRKRVQFFVSLCAVVTLSLGATFAACARRPAVPMPPPGASTLHVVKFRIYNTRHEPVPNATVTLQGGASSGDCAGTTNGDGYTACVAVPNALTASHLFVHADGYAEVSQHVDLPAGVELTVRVGDPAGDPQDIHLDALAPRGPPFGGALRVQGRFFFNDLGIFRVNFADCLSGLVPGRPVEPFLDWVVSRGFNGVRVFAGYLSLGDGVQTPEQARAALPGFLDSAQRRGLYVEVTINTGTATGYSIDEHTRLVGNILRGRANVLAEIANEPWNIGGGQIKGLDASRLLQLRRLIPAEIPTALGAAESDESTENAGGDYVTAHLDRGRDEWNQARRITELRKALADATNKPVIDNERIGAAEPGTKGQRLYDPAFFFCTTGLDRALEIGSVYHFEDGLHVTFPIGATQDAAAVAAVEAWNAVDTYLNGGVGSYINSNINGGWPQSPVETFRYSDGAGAPFNTAVRVISSTNGPSGASIVVGGNDVGIVWGRGWHPTGVSVERPGCLIYGIAR